MRNKFLSFTLLLVLSLSSYSDCTNLNLSGSYEGLLPFMVDANVDIIGKEKNDEVLKNFDVSVYIFNLKESLEGDSNYSFTFDQLIGFGKLIFDGLTDEEKEKELRLIKYHQSKKLYLKEVDEFKCKIVYSHENEEKLFAFVEKKSGYLFFIDNDGTTINTLAKKLDSDVADDDIFN